MDERTANALRTITRLEEEAAERELAPPVELRPELVPDFRKFTTTHNMPAATFNLWCSSGKPNLELRRAPVVRPGHHVPADGERRASEGLEARLKIERTAIAQFVAEHVRKRLVALSDVAAEAVGTAERELRQEIADLRREIDALRAEIRRSDVHGETELPTRWTHAH